MRRGVPRRRIHSDDHVEMNFIDPADRLLERVLATSILLWLTSSSGSTKTLTSSKCFAKRFG